MMRHGFPWYTGGWILQAEFYSDMTIKWKMVERVKGYHLHYLIAILKQDIGSYITQQCGKSFTLNHCPMGNSYKECSSDKNMIIKYRYMEKVLFESWLDPCPRKLVVENDSTELVGTLKCLYIKYSQNPSRKNFPTRLEVEGFPQAYNSKSCYQQGQELVRAE